MIIESIGDVRGVAELKLKPITWLEYEVRRAHDRDAWEVRARAKAFDYYGVVCAQSGKPEEHLAVELDGLVEQMQENILHGYAPRLKDKDAEFIRSNPHLASAMGSA